MDDKLVRTSGNPAKGLRKNLRRALTVRQLIDINDVAAATATDPALVTLILRLHAKTACR